MKYVFLILICLFLAFAVSFIQLDKTRQQLGALVRDAQGADSLLQDARQQAAHQLGAKLVANLVDGHDTTEPFPPGFIKGLHSDRPDCDPALSAIYRIQESQHIFFAYGCLARHLLQHQDRSPATQRAI